VHHLLRLVRQCPEVGCYLVHAHVGTLGGEQYGYEQGVGVRVVQGDGDGGVEFVARAAAGL